MSDFFKGVRKHIGKLDASHLREQFERVADALEQSETLIRTLKEGLVRLDSQGLVIQANPAARQLLGMPPEDFLPKLGLPLGKSSKREIAVTYPEFRTLEIQTIPFDDETIVYVRDVTAERARTEEELRAGAAKAVCDLAAGVAHEIGNPLNSLGIHLQLLEREIDGLPESDDRESLASHVRIAKSEIARLDRILSQFLKALRPGNPDCKAMPLPPALRETLATLETEIADRGIAVAVADPPASLPDAWADATQVQQAFYNVIRNAIQAMDSGGRLDISFGTTRHMVWVAFRDNGPGIPSDRMGELFQPFSSTKRNGHGMGLMIVQRILRDHGGNVVLETSPAGTRIQLNFQCDGPRMLLLDASSTAP